jgi:DNA-binding Lrp family transcriptional regulator
MDTLEGIAEWWIMRQRIRVDVDRLLRALEHLTERGILERIGAIENPRYRLRA